MKGPTIVKVQISIATTASVRQALVYNKDRSFLYQGPMHHFPGLRDEPKAFYEAEIIDHGAKTPEIVFGKRLPDQGW